MAEVLDIRETGCVWEEGEEGSMKSQVLLFPSWHLPSFSMRFSLPFSVEGSIVAGWMQGTTKQGKKRKQ